jgi:hypothetical protein
MHTRRLGQSDLDITPVGFGAWAIGGSIWEYVWALKMMRIPSGRSTVRWSSAATGSIPRWSTAWASPVRRTCDPPQLGTVRRS